MQRPVDVIVTGFTRSPVLLKRSLAPLRRLRQEGIVRHIHCVTWDSPDLDSYTAQLQTMPEITLTRVPQPQASGNRSQCGVVYQIRNLEAGLALLPLEADALVLKWRPDFVASHAFLRDKLLGFESWSKVPDETQLGVTMPPALFENRLWLPWADSNSPFFFEDAVFLGTQRDIANMVTPITAEDLEILGNSASGAHVNVVPYVHVMRFAKPFLSRYPVLENYLKLIRYFCHDLDYRRRLVPFIVDNGFFWHLLVANAWIMHSQYHIDIGAPGDLSFYANLANPDADWADFATLKTASPYSDVQGWREGTEPGLALPCVCRAFGRLMDDAWQQALFSGGTPDLPRETLMAVMDNIANYRDGRLAEIEAEFYDGVERIYHSSQPAAQAER